MARTHLKLKDTTFEEPFPVDDPSKASQSPIAHTPAFIRSQFDQAWQRHATNSSTAAAILALALPTSAGLLLGHAVAGVAIGAVALLAVGLLCFCLWVLDNTPPF